MKRRIIVIRWFIVEAQYIVVRLNKVRLGVLRKKKKNLFYRCCVSPTMTNQPTFRAQQIVETIHCARKNESM